MPTSNSSENPRLIGRLLKHLLETVDSIAEEGDANDYIPWKTDDLSADEIVTRARSRLYQRISETQKLREIENLPTSMAGEATRELKELQKSKLISWAIEEGWVAPGTDDYKMCVDAASHDLQKVIEEALKAELFRWAEANRPEAALLWQSKELTLLKDYEAAISLLEKAVVVNPDCEDCWLELEFHYRELGMYDEAINCLDEAIRISPTDSIPWGCKAMLLSEMGKKEDSKECARKAAKLNPLWHYLKIALPVTRKLDQLDNNED